MPAIKRSLYWQFLFNAMFIAMLCIAAGAHSSSYDPLASWSDGTTKNTILSFVSDTTKEDSKDYVKPEERIAVFDNDGTLWAEQPMYFQVQFALDQVKNLAPEHPEWKDQQPFKAVLEDDQKTLAASGTKGLGEILAATHSGMTTEAYTKSVAEWLKTAQHPRFHRPYNEMVYQPMLELLSYLRENGYKTYIVSGGGIEFMRVFAQNVYGIPPEQVIGSSGATSFSKNPDEDSKPELVKQAKIEFLNDGVGKPESINRVIGRRPVIAFGNSDGDQQMLEWVAARKGASLAALIHHTDAKREWAYDRNSRVGKLDKALSEAMLKHWLIVNMKNDWKVVFPPEHPIVPPAPAQ